MSEINGFKIFGGIVLALVSLFSGGCSVILVLEEIHRLEFDLIGVSAVNLIFALFTGYGAVRMFLTAKDSPLQRRDGVAEGGDDDERLR